jgi:outer membrane protein TolC
MIDSMQRIYNRAIGWSMENRRTVLISGGAIFFVGLGVLQLVKQQFFPLAERDQFVMDIWMPEGSRIEATDAAVRRVEQAIKSDPMIKNYSSFIGSGAPRFYYDISPQPPAENFAQILVNTQSVSQTSKIVDRLRKQLPAVVPEAMVFVKELQQGDDMEAPVEVRISGDDDAVLRSSSNQVEDILRHTPGAGYIHTDWHEANLQTGVHLNDEIANRLGFTNSNVAQQIAIGFDGAGVATFWEGDRDIDITLRLKENERQSVQSLADLYVQSPSTGARIPLRSIATLTPELQPARIVHRNGVLTITIRCFATDGYLPSQVLASSRKQIAQMNLPDGYHVEYGGEEESQDETSGDMNWALAISLLLIFLVLLLQFRTLVDPLIVMAAFPLALPGAALGLFITHNPFGFTAFVGIISLGGLVVRNSIILIDAIYERMKSGTPLVQAAMEAGERRLRPIFLTTMAAAVGVIPMIVSGSSLWSPLASVIAFGLLVSMFFTLIVIPVLFVAVHSLKATQTAVLGGVVVAVLLLMGTPETSYAQTRTIALDDAIRMAQEQNRTIRIARLKVDESGARLTQARADYFPHVTNESNLLYMNETQSLTIPQGALGTSTQSGPIPNKNTAIELGKQNLFISTTTVAQPLSQLFKIHAGVDAAHADVTQARADAERAEEEVALNVRKIYYNLLAIEQRRKAIALRIQAGEEKLTEARNAVSAGAALDVQVQDGTAEIAEAQNGLGTLEDTEDDLKADLADLIGLGPESDFVLQTPAEEVALAVPAAPLPSPDKVDLIHLAKTNNPEIASAHGMIDKAGAGLRAARLEFVPDISLFAEHVYQSGVPLLPDNSATVGLRLEWTLSEFGKRTGLISERKAQLSQANENLRQTEDRVQIDVEKTLRKLRRSDSALKAAQAAVTARTEMRRITADQVEAKTANPSSLSDAEAKLAEVRAQLFSAHMEQATARAELEKLLGR